MTDTDPLSELHAQVYRLVIPAPGLSLLAIARQTGRSAGEVMAALQRLQALCLVRRDDAHRYLGLSPALAEAQALGAEELELTARRVELESRRMTIREVVPQWTAYCREHAPETSTELVHDAEDIMNVLMHFAEICETEILWISPGRVPNRLDGASRMAMLFSLERGVHARALYHQGALRERTSRSYLRELAEHGARVRATGSIPLRCMVIDRRTALVPLPTEATAGSVLAIIREPNIVSWFVANFEDLWSEARPLADLLGPDQSAADLDQTRVAILRLMGEGEKDEAISRRLSVSVRTCRRHIADYMAQVGASSRFQAGVIAAREGHLDATPIN